MTEDDLQRDLAISASIAAIDCAGPLTTFPDDGKYAHVATICKATDYVTYIKWLEAAVKRWPLALAEVKRLRELHHDDIEFTAEGVAYLREVLNPSQSSQEASPALIALLKKHVVLGQDAPADEVKRLGAALAQRDRDWDALLIEIALAVGDDEDREAATLGETDEFDPWHALRAAAAATAKLHADLAAMTAARDALADIAVGRRFDDHPMSSPRDEAREDVRIEALRAIGKDPQ